MHVLIHHCINGTAAGEEAAAAILLPIPHENTALASKTSCHVTPPYTHTHTLNSSCCIWREQHLCCSVAPRQSRGDGPICSLINRRNANDPDSSCRLKCEGEGWWWRWWLPLWGSGCVLKLKLKKPAIFRIVTDRTS